MSLKPIGRSASATLCPVSPLCPLGLFGCLLPFDLPLRPSQLVAQNHHQCKRLETIRWVLPAWSLLSLTRSTCFCFFSLIWTGGRRSMQCTVTLGSSASCSQTPSTGWSRAHALILPYAWPRFVCCQTFRLKRIICSGDHDNQQALCLPTESDVHREEDPKP